jgi:biopolymer transport protein TolR
MGMAVGPAAGVRAEINITPMIDVLLVLIIIFMIITPLQPEGLPALVPQPAAVDTPTQPAHEIVITVRPGGVVLLNREPLDLPTLKTRLAHLFAAYINQAVFVRGEGDLQFRDVAEVIDLADGVGVYRVALMRS